MQGKIPKKRARYDDNPRGNNNHRLQQNPLDNHDRRNHGGNDRNSNNPHHQEQRHRNEPHQYSNPYQEGHRPQQQQQSLRQEPRINQYHGRGGRSHDSSSSSRGRRVQGWSRNPASPRHAGAPTRKWGSPPQEDTLTRIIRADPFENLYDQHERDKVSPPERNDQPREQQLGFSSQEKAKEITNIKAPEIGSKTASDADEKYPAYTLIKQQEQEFVPIPMENFKGMMPKEQMQHLLKNEKDFFDIKFVSKYPPNYEERTKRAVEETKKWAMKLWLEKENKRVATIGLSRQEQKVKQMEDEGIEYSSGSDSDACPPDDEMDDGFRIKTTSDPLEKVRPLPEHYITFVEALPWCTPLDFGFHVFELMSAQSETCYCPLSSKLKPWRIQCNVSLDIPSCTAIRATKRMAPTALIAHLRDMSSEDGRTSTGLDWHAMILKFQEFRYDEYLGSNLRHKSFYGMNTKEWRRAEAKEKLLMNFEMEKLQANLDAAQRRNAALQEKIEKLRRVDPEKAAATEEKLSCFQKFKKDWNIPDPPHLEPETTEQLTFLRKRTDGDFDDLRLLGNMQPRPTVKLTLTEPFDLQKLMRDLMRKDTVHQLFQLGNDVEFLNDWEVRFKMPQGSKYGAKRGDVPNDKGGLSRQLLSKMWEQLHHIRVPLDEEDDSKTVPLFDFDSGYCWPTKDETLLQKLKKSPKEARDMVRPVGRAVGRIFLHAMGNRLLIETNDENGKEKIEVERFTIAHHVVPNIIRRYIFQGIKPTSPFYHESHILEDLCDTAFSDAKKEDKKLVEYLENFLELFSDSNEGTECERLRRAAEAYSIDGRSIVLDSILEGLTYNAKRDRYLLNPAMTASSIDKLFFAKHKISISEIIPVLNVKYDSSEIQFLDTQHVVFDISETGKRQGHLVDILRDMEKEKDTFPADFLELVTGCRFLPQHEACITIEFNSKESKSDDSVPVAHTCTRELKLPGTAYGGDYMKLLRKIKYAMRDSLARGFNME